MNQNQFAIFYRYFRLLLNRWLRQRKAARQEKPATIVPVQAEKTVTKNEFESVAPVTVEAASVPAEQQAAPTPEVSSGPDRAIVSKLEKKFQAKQNAREARQLKLFREKSLNAQNASVQEARQLEFDFGHSGEADEAVAESLERDTLTEADYSHYELPPLSLLALENTIVAEDQAEAESKKKAIQDTLDSFFIDADVLGHKRGPRITLFKLNVARGIKVATIAGIHNDLAMSLSASTLRILAPVPGHDYVGLEVPNRTPDIVRCGASLASPTFAQSKGLLPVILGRDVEGDDIVLDLAKAPHLLVAGATGSGKSVCLNNIVMSLLYRFRPDELKMIMVDPKVVELSVYGKLPHLLVPVITDVDLVVLALRWVIDEMQRRYKMLAKVGVRNLEGFNRRPPDPEPVMDEFGRPIPQKLPFIVVIIDEMADIMLTAKQDVETCLARIAQLSRAVGIHCIVATQRPSVNVITGVIKANFPTRIAFQVSSQVDSRTIIDGKGAEALLGQGDMLFKSANAFRMQRLQGALVTDQEIDAVVRFCAQQGPHPDDFGLINTAAESTSVNVDDTDFGDTENQAGESLIRAAIEIIIRDQKASVSYVQRRLKIGYNKAATIIETLEKRGVIGPQIGTAPREIIAQSIEEAMNDEDY